MMTFPGGVPPPQKKAAAKAGTKAAGSGVEQKQKHAQHTTTDAERLSEMADAVLRDGELWRFIPTAPAWYRRIGAETFGKSATRLTLTQRRRLQFVHRLAQARRRGAEIAVGTAAPGPTHSSIAEARAALSAVFDDILADTLAYHAAMTRMAA